MGRQSAAFGVTDISSLLRQIVLDLSTLHFPAQNWRRAAGGKSHAGGSVVDLSRGGGKSHMGGSVIDFSRGGSAGGGKQSFGFGVDVINILRDLSGRIDKLAQRGGTSSASLHAAVNLQSVFASARASGIDREALAKIVKEELENAFKGK